MSVCGPSHDSWSGLCAGLFLNYGAGQCECAEDECLDRAADLQFGVYFATLKTQLTYSLLPDGSEYCTNHNSLTGLWRRGSLKACMLLVADAGKTRGLCQGDLFQYESIQADCRCATDDCSDRTPNDRWNIYQIYSGETQQPAANQDFSLVVDGYHCSAYNNLRVAGLWTMGGSLQACGELATGPALAQGLCGGGFFQYAASNGDCGCATDAFCEGWKRIFLSNWAIYYQHPSSDHLLGAGASLQYERESLKSYCSNYVNLRNLGFFRLGGSLEQCGLVAISRAGAECKGSFFQFRSSNGDCGCSQDDCEAKTVDDSWDIWKVNSEVALLEATTSGQPSWKMPRIGFLWISVAALA